MTAVALQLGLTGASGADTAAQSGHLDTVTRQAGGGVLELGQLHLQFTLGGDGVEGEDIQNQHGAVDHTKLHFTVAPADIVLQVADLDGGEVAVEDHQTDRVVAAQIRQLLHLTRANEGTGVGGGLVLHHAGENLAAGGVQQAGQLVKADLYLGGIIVTGDDTHKDGLNGCRIFLAGHEGVFIFGHIGTPFGLS